MLSAKTKLTILACFSADVRLSNKMRAYIVCNTLFESLGNALQSFWKYVLIKLEKYIVRWEFNSSRMVSYEGTYDI